MRQEHRRDDVPRPTMRSNRVGSGGWALLKDRNFGPLWTGQLVSQIGDSLNRVALLWFVYQLTGSTLKTSLIGLLQTIPPLLLSPVIGVFLDRLPKKTVMLSVDLIRAGLVLIIPVLHLMDALTLPRLYLLVFCISIFSTIFGPALASSVPFLVGRSHLTAANALLQTTTNVGLLAGPAIGGAGIALVGPENVLYLNVVTFLVSALCLIPVRIADRSVPTMLSRRSVLEDGLVGVRFVVSHPAITTLMIAASVYSMGAAAFVFLLPAIATSQFDLNAVETGGLWSLLGVGMLSSSIWLSVLQEPDLRGRLRLAANSLILSGVAMAVFGMVSSKIGAIAMILFVGSGLAFFTPLTWSFLQSITPPRLLARVLTTFGTVSMAMTMAGMVFFGWVADAFSPATSLFGAGGIFFATALMLRHVTVRYGLPSTGPAPRLTFDGRPSVHALDR